MPPRFSLNQTRIMTTFQISTIISNSSKTKFFLQNTSSSISVTTSMEDETKNGAEFLVTVPLDTKKQLSCNIKKFPTLNKEGLESVSLIPEQILQYGALDPVKDSFFKTFASKVRKSLRTGRPSIRWMSSVLLS